MEVDRTKYIIMWRAPFTVELVVVPLGRWLLDISSSGKNHCKTQFKGLRHGGHHVLSFLQFHNPSGRSCMERNYFLMQSCPHATFLPRCQFSFLAASLLLRNQTGSNQG